MAGYKYEYLVIMFCNVYLVDFSALNVLGTAFTCISIFAVLLVLLLLLLLCSIASPSLRRHGVRWAHDVYP